MTAEDEPELLPRAFEVRGELVMLAADVAVAFGVETRQVVQNIKNNPEKLPKKYAFELTEAEVGGLRSSRMISKPGRGGSRAVPWVLTQKGIIRLATIMDSPQALAATDLIVDVFTEVLMQIVQGNAAIRVSSPSRLAPSNDEAQEIAGLRRQVVKAIENLLNTTIDTEAGTTVREELGDVAKAAMDHIKEWMRSKKVSNEKIEAEALLIVEQTRDMFERRQADLAGAVLDRERKALENFKQRIEIAEQLLAMMDRLEPNAVIKLMPQFAARPLLKPPDED